jgi:hypothetical protein
MRWLPCKLILIKYRKSAGKKKNRSNVSMTKETSEVTNEFDGIEFRFLKESGLRVGPIYTTYYRIIESRTRYSSYFIIKDHGPFQKIDKDNYDSVFLVLFGNCSEIQEELIKNPDLRKFKNFMILAEVYNHYLSGLSYLGEGNEDAANENFRKSVELDQNQVWSKIMLHLKIKL